MIRTFAHVLLFLFPLSLTAQMPVFRAHPVKEPAGLRFTTIFQERHGWLWFGAKNGLYRFDGLSYQPIGLPDSLAQVPVTAIYETDGRLWVGFDNGSIGFVAANYVFLPAMPQESADPELPPTTLRRWQPEEGTPAAGIRAFVADPSGALWIATYGEGLYCWKNERLYQFDQAEDQLASQEVYALACDGLGRIWAATDAGVSICTMPVAGQKTVQNLTVADGLPDEIISTVVADHQGNIWLGAYDGGVSHYDVSAGRFDFSLPDWPYGPVSSLAWFADSELWVGTAENGVVRLYVPGRELSPLPDGAPLAHTGIGALLKDREGLLWALNSQGAAWSANPRLGMLITPFEQVQATCVDAKGRLWAGTAQGLFVRENGRFRAALPGRQNVISLCAASDGSLWAGTFGNGVFVLSADGRVERHLSERDGLSNGSVLSMAADGDRVWLATLGGVTAVGTRQSRLEQFSRQHELGTQYVYKVFRDSRGRIWFGTDGAGLSVLENGAFRQFTQAGGEILKTIYAIAEDASGRIWFSTEGKGLFSFDGQNFRRYTQADRLHSLSITGLEMTGNGELLVAYEDGLDLLNPETGHVTYWEAPGIAELNLNALCRDAAGNVWLGGQRGILRLASFRENFLFDPQTSLTAVSVFLQAVDFVEKNSFPYDQNYFIFNFTGLWYSNPESVRYRYRLDDYDLNWKITQDHLASYPNLPPGRYTFRVQATEHGGFEGTPEATYTFEVRSPVWTRWWFVVLCALGLGGLLYAFVANREMRLRQEARLKRESVVSQFAALKSQINPHFLFNSFNTLITIIEENPKIAVEYVEHLADFYRKIMLYREKDLISLQEEMDLVGNFDFLLKKRFEDGFHLDARVNGRPGLIMPLTLQMLVENAVKHNVITRSRPLTVEIYIEPERGDYIVVRNNIQRKIKPEPSTHFGLQSLINRYRLLGERPVVVEENEAFFLVKVPILKKERND